MFLFCNFLQAERFCYSYKDLDSGAKNTLQKGKCPCFCFIDSLTRSSTSTHGTLGSFQIQKITVWFWFLFFFFPTENPGKETHVLEIRNCQLICKLTGHCYKCLPHICPNQPKWQYWKAPIWLQYVALSLPACGDSQLVTPQVIFSSPLHFELLPETSVLTVPEKHKTPFSKWI